MPKKSNLAVLNGKNLLPMGQLSKGAYAEAAFAERPRHSAVGAGAYWRGYAGLYGRHTPCVARLFCVAKYAAQIAPQGALPPGLCHKSAKRDPPRPWSKPVDDTLALKF